MTRVSILRGLDLSNFDFWSGAQDTVEDLTTQEINIISQYLVEMYPEAESLDRTTINDFFWFERDFIAETLGYTDYDELMEDRR